MKELGVATSTGMLNLDGLYAARAREARVIGHWPDSPEGTISLAYGFAAPEKFPTDGLVAATAEVLAEDAPRALNYGPTYPGLVRLIAGRLQARGIESSAERVLVTHGSSQAIGLLARVFLDPGDVVLIEGPTFLGAVNSFREAGARLVTVNIDGEGLDPAVLEATLEALQRAGTPAKLLYTIPTFHNPSGTTMPLERRERLLALAAVHNLRILEDDAYGELYFGAPPPPSLASLDRAGVVVYIGTFSKILAPGVRIGFAHARPEIIERLVMFKIEGGNGPYLTRVVERYCADGRLDEHITGLRQVYRQKAHVMFDALERELGDILQYRKPAGGFFIWGRLGYGIGAQALLHAGQRLGVTFVPGSGFYADGQGSDTIRLAFSLQAESSIVEGIRRLGMAARQVRAAGA
jgi:DNA-binding transcriptional MocR family regulator